MGRIVISENITLDGVVEDPTGEDGFERGGWFARTTDEDRAAWAEVECGEAVRAEALLLGRLTYQWLEARWSARTGPWAERLTAMPKYVVASGLERPAWANTTVLGGEVIEEVTRLRERLTGEIVVNGSGRLARALIEHALVDELRLMLYPSVLGAGERLFPASSTLLTTRLVEVRAVGSGLALLRYEVVNGHDG